MTRPPELPPLSQAQREQLAQTDGREPDVIDIPEAPAENFRFARRGLGTPPAHIRLRLDPEVLAWLQDRGAADQAHINDILRDRMHADRDGRKRM